MNGNNPLELYEPLDIIGNGSFGIIRKVRRKADSAVFARKELNFEKMSERDRKQIVAEVNILKDLNHEHIVRYHDRYVDRDAGILYILMEYCGGGDLSSVIKQSAKLSRLIPEDTIWAYFFQLLMALQHCHSPTPKGPDESGRRQQILHRDLKPENVFLDGNNCIKLGDFGLSKALGAANFANTYVGTPYYMSPELIQEKSYDTKSDIWSLGCLIYELCAHKPPFHEARTHSELSILVRNARIPPLPKGYSTALNQVIKAMLNLNPAMRPSAQQLLQHERLDFARKVSETEKMLAAVKLHKNTTATRERDLQIREAALLERESQLSAAVSLKDLEIRRLTELLSEGDERIKAAVLRREEELRVAVMKREEEVRNAMAKREEEILAAVRRREEEINVAWRNREEELRKELSDAIQWVQTRQKELADQAGQLEQTRIRLEKEAKLIAVAQATAVRKEKSPLEDVKNLVSTIGQLGHTPKKASEGKINFASLETPINKPHYEDLPLVTPASAMKGIEFTNTGEVLPVRNETGLTKLITESPQVGLNFRKIFDFESETDDEVTTDDEEGADEEDTTKRSSERVVEHVSPTKERLIASRSKRTSSTSSSSKAPPTRLRRPSIRASSGRSSTSHQRPPLPAASSWVSAPTNATSVTVSVTRAKSASLPISQPMTTAAIPPTPRYDLNDEENLPSPFLRKAEREKIMNARAGLGVTGQTRPASATGRRRSGGNVLRALAAANSASNVRSISPSPSAVTTFVKEVS